MTTTERSRITGFFVVGFLVGLITMWALVKSGAWIIKADEAPPGTEFLLEVDTTPGFNDIQVGGERTLRVEVKNPDQETKVVNTTLYGELGPTACYDRLISIVVPLVNPPALEGSDRCTIITNLGEIGPSSSKVASVPVRCEQSTEGDYRLVTFKATANGPVTFLDSNVSQAKVKCTKPI